MDCREAQSCIVPFIENKLTDEQTEAFLNHIEHCNDCYDELEVYFIVFSGIRQLDSETQNISDFKGELKKYIEHQKNAASRRKSHRTHKIVLLLCSGLFCAGILFYVYQVRNDKINFPVINRTMIEALINPTQGEPVKKSVEKMLDIDFGQYSGHENLNRKVEEENNEESRAD